MTTEYEDRNVRVEMLQLIDQMIPDDGEFAASAIAAKLVVQLEEQDFDLLHGWLYENAVTILTDYIGDILNRRRKSAQRVRTSQPRSVFSAAADSFSGGDEAPIISWLEQFYVVDADFTRKKLAVMTKSDLEFVRDAYAATARQNELEAQFFTTLAKRIPADSIVGDIFTDELLLALRGSVEK